MKPFKRDDLSQYTASELKELANKQFGVNLDARKKQEELVEEVLAHQDEAVAGEANGSEEGQEPDAGEEGEPEEEVVETAAEAKSAEEVVIGSAPAKPDPRVEVTLHGSEAPGGDQPQKVSVNGKMYTIPRDVPVRVPPEVKEVLENAMQGVLDQIQGNNGEISYRERETSRFAMTIRG